MALIASAWLQPRVGPGGGEGLARNVGLALGLGGLAYLALWWRSRGLGAPLLAQGAAHGLGLFLSAALSRFGSLAAVAVLSAIGGGHLPQARLSRRDAVAMTVSPVNWRAS